MQRFWLCRLLSVVLTGLGFASCLAAELPLAVHKGAGEIVMLRGDQPVLKYVYQDAQIPRPYFKDLKTPHEVQVSRHHPPRPGVDAEDHALLHPGLWLAFGDMNGDDSWRLKAKVAHERFVEEPRSEGNHAKFAVANRYEGTGGESICRELCRYELIGRDESWLLLWDSTFTTDHRDLVFGDQEEMGLGMRMATPLAVKTGGEITNSSGRKNEKECWGQAADWCDYSGKTDTGRCGVLVMGHPSNFKRCSFHARDYGFMAANPFAEKSFGRGQQSARTVVKPGESLRLRFGVLVYCRPEGTAIDGATEFAEYLKASADRR